MDAGKMFAIIFLIIVFGLMYYRYIKKYGLAKGIIIATLLLGFWIILVAYFGIFGLLIGLIINYILLRW